MSDPPICKDENNYYHPSTEDEIVSLVLYAKENGFQVRVRGSGHSMPQAIFTDSCNADKVDVTSRAPDGDNINIKLDNYTDIVLTVGEFVTVQAGIHLGRDPNDPLSTEENSLLYQLHQRGLVLDNLGGITHQTVGGFFSTGSSGTSKIYSVQDNVHALRFVDGNGEIFEVSRNDANQDNFNASLISLGLLGVLSRVTFRCTPTFNITGKQISSLTDDAAVDIFSDNPDDRKMGLSTFFNEKRYGRILWWPQTSQLVDMRQDRLQVWEASRIRPSDDFVRNPFVLFESVEIMQLYSYLMIFMGNIEDMDRVRCIANGSEDQFKKLMIDELMEKHGMNIISATFLANILHKVNTDVVLDFLADITESILPAGRNALLPHFSAAAIRLLNQIHTEVSFQDHAYLGLPMDNSADDILVPVMWTELWVPLPSATQATAALRDYFKGLPGRRYERTGNNAWELYASKASDAWLSMSYSNKTDDEWKDGAFRIDPYWFIHNSAEFRDLFRPIWLLLKNMDIPFRLHWGKSFPEMTDLEITPNVLVRDQYPRLQEFLTLRQLRDPDGIFLNSYWRHWLGIA